MKILHLTESFPPINDATSAAVFGTASALSKMDIVCDVVVPNISDIPNGLDFQVHTYQSIGMVADGEYPLGFPYFPGTLNKLLLLEPDIIHAHSPFASMTLARRLQKKLKKPVILSYHSKYHYDIERHISMQPVRKRAEAIVLNALRAADEVWIPSKTISAELLRIGYSGGHYVMENGAALTPGEPNSELISELRTRFNISYNEPVLLFVGRMAWHKNIRVIIDALKTLHNMDFRYRMLFVGDGVDRAAMEDYVAERKLDGLARFVGSVNDPEHVRAFYNLSDLLVYPSVSDNAPPALFDAAACGLPALLAQGSDAAANVEDGVSGFLCNPEPESIADAIVTALSDRRVLRKVGAAAKTKLYIPWDIAAEKMKKRYQMVSRLHAEQKNIV